MSREFSVNSYCSPVVLEDFNIGFTLIYHWLYRKNHSRLEFNSLSRRTVIGNLWAFMQFLTNSMSDKVAHHRETVGLDIGLYGVGDVR